MADDTDTDLLNASADDLTAMGLPPAMTIEDLRTFLTDGEIAAMAEGDDPLVKDLPDDIKAGLVREKSAFEELNPDAEDEAEDQPDGAAEEPAVEEQAEPEAAATDPEPEQVPAPVVDDTPDPVLALKDTAGLEDKVSGFDDQIEALQQQYDDGELTNADFKARLKELTADQARATVELERTRDANQRAQQDYADAWYGKVQAYTAARPELMDQRPIAGEPNGASAYQVFDQALRHINSEAGAAQFGHLTMAQRIEAASILANEYVKTVAGKELLAPKVEVKAEAEPKPEPKAEATPASEKAKEPGPRTDPRPEPVKTLGGVIAASDNEVEDSRFAAIDAMDPIAAEAAIARLTPAEREKYLAG